MNHHDVCGRLWNQVHFGTNKFVGLTTTSSAATAGGSRLFEARMRADGHLFLSADLYHEHGVRLGAFTSHVWQTTQRAVELSCARNHVDVRHRATGDLVLSVTHCDNQLVVVA